MREPETINGMLVRTTPTPYTPDDWYWQREDGALYSSARGVIVTQADAPYTRWVATGQRATPWPKDADGNQTHASLQAVLPPSVYASRIAMN